MDPMRYRRYRQLVCLAVAAWFATIDTVKA